MNRPRLRMGLVGCGGIGSAYLAALHGHPWIAVTAIADADVDRAADTGDRAGAACFASHEDLLASGACDAVLVCTPPVFHARIVEDAIDAGHGVLCEKPFALHSETARRLIARGDRAGVVVTMASKFRFVDDVVRARDLLASGVLGEVQYAENAFASPVDMRHRWNANPSISGGGVLIDNGTHSADVLRFLLGPIDEVLAVEGPRVQGLAVEDSAQLFVRTTAGTRGAADLSWSMDKHRPSYLEVHATEGAVRIGWSGAHYREAWSPDWVAFGGGYDKHAALRGTVENFAGAVVDGTPLHVTGADAIASVDVVQAAYRSMASARPEHLEPVVARPQPSPASTAPASMAHPVERAS